MLKSAAPRGSRIEILMLQLKVHQAKPQDIAGQP